MNRLDRIIEIWGLTPPSATKETADILKSIVFPRDVDTAVDTYKKVLYLWGQVLDRLDFMLTQKNRYSKALKDYQKVFEQMQVNADNIMEYQKCTERQFLGTINFHCAWAVGQALAVLNGIEQLRREESGWKY